MYEIMFMFWRLYNHISSTAGLPMKLQIVVRRCVLIGLDIPSEPTCGHIVSTMLSLANMSTEGSQAHGIILDFKRLLKLAFKHQVGELSITDFPADPSQLPESRINHAYPGGLPDKIQTPSPTPSIPLRRSSSSVRIVTPLGHHTSTIGSAAMDPNNLLLQLLAQTPLGQMARSHGSSNGFSLQMLSNHRRPALPSPASSPEGNHQRHLMAITNGSATESTAAGALALHTPTPQTPAPLASGGPSPAVGKEAEMRANIASKGSDQPFEFPALSPQHQAQLVLDAMDRRSAARKEAKEADEADGSDTVKQSCLKRPAAAKTSQQSAKKKKVSFKEPKAAAKAAGSPTSSAASTFKRPSVPPPGSGTQFYRGGKIHESTLKGAWRVFRKAGDRVDKACVYVVV